MTGPGRVAIVLADNPDLVERLGREIPVWAASSDRIETIAPRLRGDGVDLTTFNFDPESDAEEQLLGLIHEVELHHGASGGRSPLARLDVYGTGLKKRATTALEQLGLPSVEVGAESFSAVAAEA